MPSWITGKDGERAWQKAKGIVAKEYGAAVERNDPDRFYSLVTTVYKSVCKSPDYDCGIAKKTEDVSPRLDSLMERLEPFCLEAVPDKKIREARQTLGFHVQDRKYIEGLLKKDRSSPDAARWKKAVAAHTAAIKAYERAIESKAAKDLKSAKDARLRALKIAMGR